MPRRCEFEQAAELRNQIGALSRVLHQQSVEDNTGGARQGRRHPGGARCRAAAPASTWRWCAAAATSATGRTFRRTSRTRSALDARRRGGEATPPSADARGAGARGLHRPALPRRPPPPLLVLSHAVDKALIEALSRHSGVKVDGPAPAARAAPRLARHGDQRRRARAGAAAGRGGLAAGAHARAGRRARPRGRRPGRASASSASTSATPPARRRRRRAWCSRTTRCRARSTAATTSTASPAATTTPRCARC